MTLIEKGGLNLVFLVQGSMSTIAFIIVLYFMVRLKYNKIGWS